jgi:hypothetical protein
MPHPLDIRPRWAPFRRHIGPSRLRCMGGKVAETARSVGPGRSDRGIRMSVWKAYGFSRRWKLLVPAVLGPAVEVLFILMLGPHDSVSMAPQLTAPPPFDLFHDLRWISVYHNSWPLLAVELLAMLAFRSAYVAWIVQAAWPGDRPPPMPAAALRAGFFYAASSLLLFPFVALLFGMALTHLSYLFFVALPPVIAIVLVIHRGALAQAAGRWWRWRPTWSSLAWAAGSFLWLTVAGAAISVLPAPVAILVAGGAGLLNALAVASIVRSIATRWDQPPQRHQRLVPIALVTTFAVVLGGTVAGFAGDAPTQSPDTRSAVMPEQAHGHPVLVAAGFNSQWNPPPRFPLPRGFVAWRYSYLGMGPGRRLLPYRPADTLQPLVQSAQLMGQQVDALYQAYKQPVTIVAESEGALVARTYLLRVYRPLTREVNLLVILDMPVGASAVYYPPPGVQGWGVGSGWALRGLAFLIRSVGPLRVSADAPLFRDIAECRSLMSDIVASPPPAGVRQVSIQALADAVDEIPATRLPAEPRYVVTSAHGGLIRNRLVQSLIFRTLSGTMDGRPPNAFSFPARLIGAVSDPWHSPSLVRRLTSPRICSSNS